ncbi:MAG: site-specific integrase [Caulobacteraceae bacterium]
MAFVTDKEELKPGLVIFRRADVAHRNWYCRVKLPKADRYKTISLKTADIGSARERAFDHDADIRFRIKHDVPVFNRFFSEVALEYVALQETRAKRGEVSAGRPKKIKSVVNGALNAYVGSTQIQLVGAESWEAYPGWRRATGSGRYFRTGATRRRSADGGAETAIISDATIRFEMSIFGAVMNYAITKRYVPAANRFEGKPKLKTMRRDAFTLEEYRRLHTVARAWVKAAARPSSAWYRTVAYNFILIMCNTGMRPSEAKNLRWRDVTSALDRDKRELVVLCVQGKGKSRKLVAPKSVGDYLDRIKAIAKAKAPDDAVFTTLTGKPAKSLYQAMVEDLLIKAELRDGPSGVPRSTYCFRHTYATFRLGEGVDVYFLAEQMGTSVKMIEDHYGHVNTIKHADLVLQGMGGWDQLAPTEDMAPSSKAAPPVVEGRARVRARTGAPSGSSQRPTA